MTDDPIRWKLHWRRSGRASLRRLASADRRGLEALAASDGWIRTARSPARGGERIASQVLELDRQVVGVLEGSSGRLEPELGPQPWSRVEWSDEPLEPVRPPAETLLVGRLGWLRRSDGDGNASTFLVERALPDECRRLGVARAVVPVEISTRRTPSDADLSPAAFLQQVHYRALVPRKLAPFLKAKYRLRGYHRPHDLADDSRIVALVVWEHPRL